MTTVTTAGSNGAPEDAAKDDPFAYLYRPAEGEQAATQPRDSYSRPVEVGRAQYGQQSTPQPPARPQPPAQVTAQLPQQPRYAEHSRPQPGEQQPAGRSKGVVIGAVAVVAAIAIGAGVALSMGDPGKTKDKASGGSSAPVNPSASASGSSGPSASPTPDTKPIADASTLKGQNAPSGNSVKGARSADGSYLTLTAGSSVTWTFTAPSAGAYKFWLHFNNTGQNFSAAVTVNGKDRDGGITVKNYSGAGVDPAQAWYSTNIWPELQAGTNTITVGIPAGSGNSILVDQVALTPMSVETYPS
ncbi:hypothetical protein F4556_003072 [Kitasatospora gansuensis]|uniref:CBM6 domain-containing protein n=1 Tax=Kitasatospora gansuensis TaxID=258050 RepID=A0A7W7SC34_9ACTN|nr:hypothetical protein [Kitasatospora gansuensis]MBB4947537.1 hypothetical protein [Kitasatospora gansuensis]